MAKKTSSVTRKRKSPEQIEAEKRARQREAFFMAMEKPSTEPQSRYDLRSTTAWEVPPLRNADRQALVKRLQGDRARLAPDEDRRSREETEQRVKSTMEALLQETAQGVALSCLPKRELSDANLVPGVSTRGKSRRAIVRRSCCVDPGVGGEGTARLRL
eukprot:scaffold3651_cov230-Prasinococcus_capsulatus_cf.AAC.5